MYHYLLLPPHVRTGKGVEIQMYLAIIACLLILIYTGGQPNKRTYEMICFYLLGWARLEELEAHSVTPLIAVHPPLRTQLAHGPSFLAESAIVVI